MENGLVISIIEPFQRFIKNFVSGGIFLLLAAFAAVVWVNVSPDTYHHLWHAELKFAFGGLQVSKSLAHWIDEALMTIFFFTVGLEIKREILVGELASLKKAMLPVVAAIGGMIVPAVIYLFFNYGKPSASGWGIPMATDIAFSLGVLALAGPRVPLGLRVFLSAFAIADDLGAVLVIAFFYTQTIVWSYIGIALVFLALLAAANFLWIRNALLYTLLGLGMWICMMGSGMHATIAGVAVALFIPARGRYDTDMFIRRTKECLNRFECEQDSCGYTILLNRAHLNAVHNIEMACHDVETPLQRLEYSLQSWVAFFILPLFALANSGLAIQNLDMGSALLHPVTLGVFFGLYIGKPLGICCFTFLAVKLLKASLPEGVTTRHVFGASILGGIGFTMSLLITGLSFSSPNLAELSKLAIFIASILCGVTGLIVLRSGPPAEKPVPEANPLSAVGH